jgi:putative aldouronate transport system permease protein
MPIMVLLFNTLINYGGGTQNLGHVDISLAPGEGIKMAALVVSVMPIMMLYPFLQRHFAKGILIGALKN